MLKNYIVIKINQFIKRCLMKLGYVLLKNNDVALINKQFKNAALEINACKYNRVAREDGVKGVIFSKDRPMQLFALLRSYYENVTPPSALIVLYNASGKKYEKAYIELANYFIQYDIEFVKEADFKNDLVSIVEKVKNEKIFFLVDDILFIRKVDMNDYINCNSHNVIASLRLGKNLSRCYTSSVKQPLPEFLAENSPQNKMKWKWSNGHYDWNYPLSVDGNLFLTDEIEILLKICEYKAPNSLEKNMQWFKSMFIGRYGICYKESVIVNIPFNKVQNENINISSNIRPEKMLKYWEEGYEIDIKKYFGIHTVSAHQEMPLYLVKRL